MLAPVPSTSERHLFSFLGLFVVFSFYPLLEKVQEVRGADRPRLPFSCLSSEVLACRELFRANVSERPQKAA